MYAVPSDICTIISKQALTVNIMQDALIWGHQ